MRFVVMSVILFLCACTSRKEIDVSLTDSAIRSVVDSTMKSYYDFECSPDTLYVGDTLRLKMKSPNGGWLAVISPDGAFRYVSRPPFESNEKHRPAIYTDELRNRTSFEIITDRTTSFNRANEIDELIFMKGGTYRIQLGEFYGDASGNASIDWCSVVFIDSTRQK